MIVGNFVSIILHIRCTVLIRYVTSIGTSFVSVMVMPLNYYDTHYINTLWLNDAIWRHKSGPTLVQVITWFLSAPNHYRSACGLITSLVQWISSEDINFLIKIHLVSWCIYVSVNWVSIGWGDCVRMFGAKPLPEALLTYCQLGPQA